MALTKALLLSDPTNEEGLALQAAIRSDMQQDMNDARALLEDSHQQEDPQKHRKAAEIILLKILYLDPENEQAKILLAATRANLLQPTPFRIARPAAMKRQNPVEPAKVQQEVKGEASAIKLDPEPPFERASERLTMHEADSEVPFVVAPPPEKKQQKDKRFRIPFIFVIIGVGFLAIFLARQ